MRLFWNQLLYRNFSIIMPIGMYCQYKLIHLSCVLSFTLTTKICLHDISHVCSPGKLLIFHYMFKILLVFNQKGKKLTWFTVHVLLSRFIWRFRIWKCDSALNFLSNGIWHEDVCSSLKIGLFWGSAARVE